MGPLGRLLAPYGDLPFEEAVRQFREAFSAALSEGPDLLLIETMTDLLEVKACVLGAQEAMEACGTDLPLLVSLTFDEKGRLLTGADIPGTAAMLMGLGVTGIGSTAPRAVRSDGQRAGAGGLFAVAALRSAKRQPAGG